MNFLIKKASAYSTEEQAALGITGIPQDWPIERTALVDPIPDGYEEITDEDFYLLKENNQASYDAWVASHQQIIVPPPPAPTQVEIVGQPKDTSDVPLSRTTVTKIGWHFQLHSIEITTAKWNGFHNKKINPITLVISDLGFVTYKLFDASQAQITDEANIADARITQMDWCVDHEMEIVGAIFSQNNAPTTDIYMWTFAAPGIANVPFGQGGLNLKLIGTGGTVDADGKAAKYLHPSIPMAGINKFRTILKHDAGVQHTFQLSYKLFKP